MDNPYRAPQGQILTPTGGANPMTWKDILFSFQGRIPRRQYWAGVGIQILVVVVVMVILGLTGNLDEDGEPSGVGSLVIVPMYIGLFWCGLAVPIKRWHDRDKSGWWILIGFIPLIGWIWSFVENGCLRGTVGPNRFGDDPT